jgi:flavin-dependent dehydrogenase
MFAVDVVVAGGGVAGLLIASALGRNTSVLLLEQADKLPRNKYWLTDQSAADAVPDLQGCIDYRYDFLDYLAYDGFKATVSGHYCLWDTDKLIGCLTDQLTASGVRILTGHRLYNVRGVQRGVLISANDKTIRARLLIDCMGFGSPLVGAKGIAEIKGYYILHGREVRLAGDQRPVALDNVMIARRPTFFEIFPTSRGTAHAAIILPSRHYKTDRALRGDLQFILQKSHYSSRVNTEAQAPSYFGIIPVGRLRKVALDHVLFFGEAGQSNPATSATGLSRMLHARSRLASAVLECLRSGHLDERHLRHAAPECMSRLNRLFQECVFESLLTFSSDDFRRLVQDLDSLPDDVINDLIFAQFDFSSKRFWPLALRAFSPGSIVGRHLVEGIVRFCSNRPLR